MREMHEHLLRADTLVSQMPCAVAQVCQGTTAVFQPIKAPAALRSVYQRSPTSHNKMELNMEHRQATWASRSDLAAAHCDHENALHQATSAMHARSESHETALAEPGVTAGKEAVPSFMEHVLALHTVNCAAEDMPDAIVESDSNDKVHKLQLQ